MVMNVRGKYRIVMRVDLFLLDIHSYIKLNMFLLGISLILASQDI